MNPSPVPGGREPDTFEQPAPTVWPMVAALGVMLMCGGLVTHVTVSAVGVVLAMMGAVGRWREVLPQERVAPVARRPAAERARAIVPSPAAVEHLRAGEAGHRVRVPVEVQPYPSGMQGGLVGGAAMAVVALLLWSGLIWAVLGMVNPALNARIDWVWFIASQIAFGLTVGLVVARAQPIATMQTWPLAARAGVEACGMAPQRERDR
jgi:hypothetical protein